MKYFAILCTVVFNEREKVAQKFFIFKGFSVKSDAVQGLHFLTPFHRLIIESLKQRK